MSAYPIQVTLENGARDCRLCLLEGRGTWGSFGDNTLLTLTLDNPQITVSVLATFLFPETGSTGISINVPVCVEPLSVSVSQQEVTFQLPPLWPGQQTSFTLFFNATGNNIIFDAMLSRTNTAGMVTVASPNGDETDYLLPNQGKRRVTLPLTPPAPPC